MFFKSFIFSFVLLTFIVQPSQAEVQAIEQLLSSGKLLLRITSLGNHKEECIQVVATNNSTEALFTRIEPGRIMLSADANIQDIIITHEMIIALAPRDQVIKQAFGFCCQSQNSGPEFDGIYALGPMSTGVLLETANYLNRHRELRQEAQQHAIWVMSDCAPISSISQFSKPEQELVAFVSDALGLPKPWYTTDHAPSADALFSTKVNRIRGEMAFKVHNYDKVSVTIIDAEHRVIKTVLSPTVYGPGDYDLPLDLFVNFWEAGEYQVLLKGERQGEIGSYAFSI